MGIKEFLNKKVSPQKVVLFMLCAGAIGALVMTFYLSNRNKEKTLEAIRDGVIEAAQVGYIAGQKDALAGKINIEEKNGEWVLKNGVFNFELPLIAEGGK